MKQGNEFILKERKNISFQNCELIKKITSIPFEKLMTLKKKSLMGFVHISQHATHF
jgi:hypothetical protein